MALQSSDLFVVQQGQVVKSVDYATLSSGVNSQIEPTDLPIASATTLGAIKVGANLQIDSNTGELEAVLPAAVEYQGNIDPTQPAPAATPGQAWIVSPGGVFDASFQNIAGQTGDVGDVAIYEGHAGNEWDLIKGLFGMGVISVRGTAPITIGGDASNPVIGIDPATTGSAGSLSAADKLKLDNIQEGADVGTVTEVTASLPLSVLDGTTTPAISIAAATTAAVGVVRLADSTAIANGTSERVVDAAQLKSVQDEVDQIKVDIGNLDIYTFEADNATGSKVDVVGDVVTYSNLQATAAQVGVARLADSSEAEAGTATNLLMTPALVKSFYLPNDFSTLQSV